MAAIQTSGPGAIRVRAGEVALNVDRGPGERGVLVVTNTADRPIQIGSHLHLPDANRGLDFDRVATAGCRLDIPAGTSVRFEPGVARTVEFVELRGARSVPGLQLRPDPPNAPATPDSRD